MASEEPARTGWTFVTSHARVLAAIARNPGVRLRDVAVESQLTERAVQGIVTDLEQAGYLTRARVGRRNRYSITTGTCMRHPAEAGLSVAALLSLLAPAYDGHTAHGSDRGASDGIRHQHGPDSIRPEPHGPGGPAPS
ncbi:helix-turn-helix transcriptional regulator [Kitasatospora sp. NPDC001574]